MKKAVKFAVLLVSAIIINFTCSCGISEKIEPGITPDIKRPEGIGLFPAQLSYVGDVKWGYIDDSGKFVLEPVYSNAYGFQPNGLAVAELKGLTGLIDDKGKFVVKPQYSYIGEFHDGRAVVNDKDGFKVIDEKGNVIFGPEGFIGNFSDERAVFYRQKSGGELVYGFIDTAGNIVIEPQYVYANNFNNGLAVVRPDDESYALIDKNGKTLGTYKFNYMGNFSDGLLAYQEKQDGLFGYMDEKGKTVIKPQFTAAQDFENNRAVVNISKDPIVNQFGLIDKNGKFIVKPQYNNILDLGEGMLALGIPISKEFSYFGSKYAIAGENGKPLTGFEYYGVENYKNGVASVYDNTQTFFLDKEGKKVSKLPIVEGSGKMEILNNLVGVDVDNRLYYTDKSGNIVYRPAECAKLDIGVTVCEVKYKPNRNYLVYYPQLSGLESKDVENSINTRLKNMTFKAGITPDMELDYNYTGDFETAFNQKVLLVLEFNAYNFPFGAAHGMPSLVYDHINVKSGRFYELKDLFKSGSDYTRVLSAIVGKQIKEHGEEMGVWADSYKGISKDQPFFITKDALNLYFEPYEIAPYAAGFPTFKIPFAEIDEIIKKDGGFWLSFN